MHDIVSLYLLRYKNSFLQMSSTALLGLYLVPCNTSCSPSKEFRTKLTKIRYLSSEQPLMTDWTTSMGKLPTKAVGIESFTSVQAPVGDRVPFQRKVSLSL